ncbi:MAG TPA: PLDc N-terminal domain-containing protein, partial [Chitinophagaceae bacterium]|nr:PLDc N-terminal domain-containing protein [Chitinophagaceae bacterium]
MNWFSVLEIIYAGVLVLVCLRIIYETDTSTKALAYLLLVIFLPALGIIIYFSFGVNYRKRKMYSKKLIGDASLAKKISGDIIQLTKYNLEKGGATIGRYKELAYMLAKDSKSALTSNNSVKLLVNGEKKFPDMLPALKQAKNHIHIEYYIYEDDEVGKSIEQVLVEKVKEGVDVRFIYDDFGSRSIRKSLARRLKKAGVKIFPFYKMTFLARFSRMNYRNHR